GDFDVRAAKTGMLYSAEIVRVVERELRDTAFPLVVDPVMVATVGASLEQDDFADTLVDRLLGRAALVTPNRFEAERLSGIRITNVESMERAARAIHQLGPGAVLVKGGHMQGPLVDVFYDGRRIRRLRGRRVAKRLHGAGCTLAASPRAYSRGRLGSRLLREWRAQSTARWNVGDGRFVEARAIISRGRGAGVARPHSRSHGGGCHADRALHG